MRALLALAFAAFQSASFDVASIKPAAPPSPGTSRRNTASLGRIDYQSTTLRRCIAYAYGVKEYQIDGPAWLAGDRWQIQAKAPEAAADDQMPAMMQTLLAERFHLQLHREKKDFDGLAIIPGKNGPKLDRAEKPGDYRTTMRFGGGGKVEAEGMTMDGLARFLTDTLARPVANETALAGAYAFTLEYAAYEARGGMQFLTTGPLPPDVTAATDPGLSVMSSIQRLGLKLESRKVPLDVVVVDRIDKTPTFN